MTQQQQIWLAATVCVAVGMWLTLPRGGARGRRLGMLISMIGLGLFVWQMPRLADVAIECAFFPLAAITVISCGASVTARNPVYTAIWFGVALLATAGLMMLQGAQFLGVATIVVYAGAILVTFLFVLMLAQPEGHAFYDRLSWRTSLPFLSGALLSSLCGAALVGMLVVTISTELEKSSPKGTELTEAKTEVESTTKESEVTVYKSYEEKLSAEFDETFQIGSEHIQRDRLESNVLGEEHVARLGAQLFSKHLIAVEVGGTLLLAALVGAVAIVAQGGKNTRRDIRDALREGGADD